MSIRFDGRYKPRGKILVRELTLEDWGPNDETAQRFENRGSVNDPTGEVEDWGRLPSTILSL